MEKSRLDKKMNFIDEYKKASNAATGSKYDSNANVTQKNLSTLQVELGKKDLIDINREITKRYLEKLYGKESVINFEKDLKHHIIYSHDESSILPYCASISLYPFLLNGLKDLGGSSNPPKHADSYIGGIINLVFLASSQLAGALAIPEFLTYFDHFLRVDYGQDYIKHLDDVLETWGNRKATLKNRIEDLFQQFTYCINQPAGARNYQSPFVNIAYFDKYYFESIFEDFVFPDGDEPNWETVKELQKMFMLWFNKERTKAELTFPVETTNHLVDKETHEYKDKEQADFISYMWASGHSFFLYQSDSIDALSSCCFRGDETIRVRNKETKDIIDITLKDFCEKYKNSYSCFEILSYNKDLREEEYTPITGTLIKQNEFPNLIEIETYNGDVIRVTPEHILLVEDKNKNLIEIKAKDLISSYEDYELLCIN